GVAVRLCQADEGLAVGTRRGLVLVVALILATSGCRWIVRASVDSAGNQANGDSYDVALSADGRFVAFESDATNLVPNDTNGDRDVFVRDNRTGAVERVFETPTGASTSATWSRPGPRSSTPTHPGRPHTGSSSISRSQTTLATSHSLLSAR